MNHMGTYFNIVVFVDLVCCLNMRDSQVYNQQSNMWWINYNKCI